MTYEINIGFDFGTTHRTKVKVAYERTTQEINSVRIVGTELDIKDKLYPSEMLEIVAKCEKVYLEQEQEMYWNGVEAVC